MGRRSPKLVVWLLATVVVSAIVGQSTSTRATAQSQGRAVRGSLRQVYHPGSLGQPSTPIKGYRGPMLKLQATKVGKTAAEPTIGVTSDGSAFFASSEMLVESPYTWGIAETDVLRSTDGGLTWKSVQQTVPTSDRSIPPANADPFVWVDRATDRIFNIDLYGACSWLNYSDDKGETWFTSPLACGNFINDHQTIGGGPPPKGVATLGYPNVLYYCFNRVVDSSCGRSLDGGFSWRPTAQPSFLAVNESGNNCGGLHGHIETDPQGRLFVPKGHCGFPWIAVSQDAGDSWNRVQVSDIPNVGTHLSVASDSAANLYFVWREDETRLPYLAISRDSGQTWGKPMMIAPPGVTESNFPVIAAGDPGKIAINFPSSTDEDRMGAERPWNQHVVVSRNALSKNPVFLSATANDPDDPVHRGNCNGRCAGMWDFIDIVIGPSGELWASASDDCVGMCISGLAYSLHNGEGIAIRQIGGPRLVKRMRSPTPPSGLPESYYGSASRRPLSTR